MNWDFRKLLNSVRTQRIGKKLLGLKTTNSIGKFSGSNLTYDSRYISLGLVVPIQYMDILNNKSGPFLPKLHISLDGMIGRSNGVYNEHYLILNNKLIARTLSPQKTSQIRW